MSEGYKNGGRKGQGWVLDVKGRKGGRYEGRKRKRQLREGLEGTDFWKKGTTEGEKSKVRS